MIGVCGTKNCTVHDGCFGEKGICLYNDYEPNAHPCYECTEGNVCYYTPNPIETEEILP